MISQKGNERKSEWRELKRKENKQRKIYWPNYEVSIIEFKKAVLLDSFFEWEENWDVPKSGDGVTNSHPSPRLGEIR